MAKTIYEKIKEVRLAKKMSQKELGEKVGLSQQAIALTEKGKRKLDVDTAFNIAIALDIYIKDLFPPEDRGTELFLDIFGKDEILEKIYFDYNQLNKKGQKKAMEQVEMLTKIDEYAKKDD